MTDTNAASKTSAKNTYILRKSRLVRRNLTKIHQKQPLKSLQEDLEAHWPR